MPEKICSTKLYTFFICMIKILFPRMLIFYGATLLNTVLKIHILQFIFIMSMGFFLYRIRRT